ncbi:hypothetical protein D3C73_1431280 [compost metagenome]
MNIANLSSNNTLPGAAVNTIVTGMTDKDASSKVLENKPHIVPTDVYKIIDRMSAAKDTHGLAG